MFEKGDSVYVIDDPERKGIVMSRIEFNSEMHYFVNINGQQFNFKEDQIAAYKIWSPLDWYLHLAKQICNPGDLPAEERVYGKARDLNQIIVKEKISGEISDILYSMHFGDTDFYPHQLKPVLQFLEDDTGSIIIADEVGLGKTIEALFIWQELSVRDDAKNLLIICPPVLREKWKDELKDRFGMNSNILVKKSLIEELKKPASERRGATVISYDLLSHNADEENDLYKLIQSKLEAETVSKCYDMVICDEAHYMRNKSTNTYKMVGKLITLCRASVFLTATPVQTSDENLFNILHMLYPKDFPSYYVFASIMEENRRVLLLVNYLQKDMPPSVEEGNQLLDELENTSYADNKSLIERTRTAINSEFDPAERTRLAYEYERLLPLARYLSRSRKSMVLDNRVIRHADTVSFLLTKEEKAQYEAVDRYLENRYESFNSDGRNNYLVGVVRRKIMASSLPVGIRSLSESLDSEDYAYDDISKEELEELKEELASFQNTLLPFEELKRMDSKYRALSIQLRNLNENSLKKIILFTGYRKTGDYLNERLLEDGIKVFYIHGSMKQDKKTVIQEFENWKGAAVLLSTEVGSEGIDLQFCDTIINYDLPWNPMRIEQRIGRVDRIGQKSDVIHIYNFFCENTIDDQVLSMLLYRINVFEESVGTIDMIMGQKIEQFLIKLSAEPLSDEEKIARVNQSQIVKEATAVLSDEIKSNVTLFSFCGKQFMDKIKKSEELKHYVTHEDLINYVVNNYELSHGENPSEEIKRREQFHLIADSRNPGFYSLQLPNVDKVKLEDFCKKKDMYTKLVEEKPLQVCFGKLPAKKRYGFGNEVIDISHPLIKWLIERNQSSIVPDKAASVISLRLENTNPQFPVLPGMYYYYLQRWDTSGTRKASRLSYTCIGALKTDMDKGQINLFGVDPDTAESLINTASEKGENCSGFRTYFWFEYAEDICKCLLGVGEDQFNEFRKDEVVAETAYKARRKRGLEVQYKRDMAILQQTYQTLCDVLKYRAMDEKTRKNYENLKNAKETQIANRTEKFNLDLNTVDEMKTVCTQRPLSIGMIFVM